MASKKIVLVVSAFPKISETFIVSKFLGLLDRGWDIHVVYYRSDPADQLKFPALLDDPRLKKHAHLAWPIKPKWLALLLLLPALTRGLLRAPRASWVYLARGFPKFGWGVFKKYYLDLEIILLQPDIVHFEFGAQAVGRTHIKDLLDTRLTVSFRGYDLNFSGLDQPGYYDQVWQHADACHFLGEDLWQRALRRGCPPGMPHELIPPAIDLNRFHLDETAGSNSVSTEDDPLVILSVGRLEWKKGYEFGLQAVRLLVDQGVACSYRIIGDGDHRDALYFARHQLGLEGVVEFLGSQAHDEVINRLAEANVFLHPSFSEGFCNVVLEAQSMGVPVICSNAGSLPENVVDGVTGFVVPRRDPQALADRMFLLARDPELRLAMGTAGRARVRDHFQLNEQLDAWERFYQALS